MAGGGSRTPRWLAWATLLLLALLCGLSFWSQWYDAQRMPTPEVIARGNAALLKEFAPGDAIRVRPQWFDGPIVGVGPKPILYGLDLDPYDRHRFKRLWLLSSWDHAEEAAIDRGAWLGGGTRTRFDEGHYRVEVGTIQQPETVHWDGYTTIRDAVVQKLPPKGAPVRCDRWDANAWQCGRTDPYLFVGPAFREMDDSFRECIAANGLPGQTAWSIRWPSVTMGKKLRFKAGNTYYAHRLPRGSEVAIEAMIDGKRVFATTYPPHQLGYPETVIPTPTWAGKQADVEFRISAKDHLDRFFCFRPQTVSE